jgi:tetratricopeptide (TPR) repeat protein
MKKGKLLIVSLIILAFILACFLGHIFKPFNHSQFINYCISNSLLTNKFNFLFQKKVFQRSFWQMTNVLFKINSHYNFDSTFIYVYILNLDNLFKEQFTPISYKLFSKKFKDGAISFPRYNIIYMDSSHVSYFENFMAVFPHEIGHFVADSFYTPNKIISYYNKANDLSSQNNYREAEKMFLNALRIYPDYVEALDNLGLLYSRNGQPEKAINYYLKSLKIDSTNQLAITNLAVVYQKTGKLDSAKYWFLKLGKINKNNPETHYGLGWCFMVSGEIDSAICHLKEAEYLYTKSDNSELFEVYSMLRYCYSQTRFTNGEIEYSKKISDICFKEVTNPQGLKKQCESVISQIMLENERHKSISNSHVNFKEYCKFKKGFWLGSLYIPPLTAKPQPHWQNIPIPLNAIGTGFTNSIFLFYNKQPIDSIKNYYKVNLRKLGWYLSGETSTPTIDKPYSIIFINEDKMAIISFFYDPCNINTYTGILLSQKSK